MAKEMKDLLQKKGGDGLLRLHRATEDKVYIVQMHEVRMNDGVETRLSKGWSEFVRSNSLEIGDYIQIDMEDWQEWLFRVRIWRNDHEVTIVDPHVIIENDGTISDVESTKFIPMEALGDDFPEFKATFTKPYIRYVPVAFARLHFTELDATTTVEVCTNKVWTAKMHISYDKGFLVVPFVDAFSADDEFFLLTLALSSPLSFPLSLLTTDLILLLTTGFLKPISANVLCLEPFGRPQGFFVTTGSCMILSNSGGQEYERCISNSFT